jgi:two-component system chemotaxis response regulator CheB
MAKTLRLKPDLLTLDLEMPEMDGFSFLRWLMKNRPTPVLIVSSYSDSKTVFKALEFGAADFISKPSKIASGEFHLLEKDLLMKVKAVKYFRMDNLSKNLGLLEVEEPKKQRVSAEHPIDTVAIGSSTGGPAALKTILTSLPADFPAAIAISQHMPKGFTASFAERLNGLSNIPIKEALEGDELENGKALICPGGFHMSFKKKGRKIFTEITESKSTDKYIPSIDIMMTSIAEIFGKKSMGVILTGMGNDGKAGMLEIKKQGGYTIVENEDTAVVYGMPQEVIKVGAAETILPLHQIPDELIRVMKGLDQDDNA